jgi:Flp pilus assembly protein TadG
VAPTQESIVRSFKSIFLKRSKKAGQRGVAAVEFAMVATPFLMLLFGLFEIMMIFFVQTTLESAVSEESRKIKTGQANAGTGLTAAQFKAGICTRMAGLADCANRLFVMVENQPTTGSLPSPMTDPTILAAPPYTPNTAAGSIVVVRGFYMWPLITPGISSALKNTDNTGPNGDLGATNRMLVATSAFRNEPFQ